MTRAASRNGRPLDQLDDRAARGARGAAALGVETGLGDAIALDPDGDPDQVTAGGATGGAGMRPVGERPEPARMEKVLLEHCT